MAKQLIVTNAFGAYALGDRISDVKDISAVLDSDSAANVVAIEVEDAPAKPSLDSSSSASG